MNDQPTLPPMGPMPAPEPTPEAEPQIPQPILDQTPSPEQAPAPADTPKPNKTKLVIIIAAAIVVIGIAVAAIFLLMPKEDSTKKEEPTPITEDQPEELPSLEQDEENPNRDTALLKLYSNLSESMTLTELQGKIDTSTMKLNMFDGAGSITAGDEIINFTLEGTTAKDFMFAKHIDDFTQYITKDEDGSYIYHNGVQQKNYSSKSEAVSRYLHTKDM